MKEGIWQYILPLKLVDKYWMININYLNFTKILPMHGGQIPVVLQGLGISIFSTGPNLVHSVSTSFYSSSTISSSNKSSVETIFSN